MKCGSIYNLQDNTIHGYVTYASLTKSTQVHRT